MPEIRHAPPSHTLALALILAAFLTLLAAAAACTGSDPEPAPESGAPQNLQEYARCWADTAQGREAQPPHRLFDTGEAALTRCRHLAPGPEHYARTDEEGNPVHGGGGHPAVPRYDYDTALHAACLEETAAWFQAAHPEVKAGHPDLFAESVCAVPPPQYTNVPD